MSKTRDPRREACRRSVLALEATAVVDFHDRFLNGEESHEIVPDPGVWRWIAENHRCNARLWGEEDRARRTDVPDSEIVRCKRAIDAANQRRNDAVEAIDQDLLSVFDEIPLGTEARLSSETAGAMIDRLSILALKIFHMGLQALRADASAEHRERCAERVEVLTQQRRDLAGCLDRLLWEVRSGTAHFKTYRQFKMYNDPALNPELYRKKGEEAEAEVDVLIPTCERPAALAATLTSLFAQTLRLRIVISDQGENQPVDQSGEVRAVLRTLRARGHDVEVHRHLPRRGLAEQRDFLLGQAQAPFVLFIDDDVVLEPDLVERMLAAIREQQCGFVGSAVIGLSHAGDVRPEEEAIEFWEDRVKPERVTPESAAWQRHHLHSAANLYHVQTRLGLDRKRQRLYKVAWVGGCVLFDTEKLRASGGFDFWPRLGMDHCGEDVYAQLRVIARFGGCGLIPSGAYHQELPTTVPLRHQDAPRVLSLELDG